jgi:hypothetical protein
MSFVLPAQGDITAGICGRSSAKYAQKTSIELAYSTTRRRRKAQLQYTYFGTSLGYPAP